jgi:hypothetical protein
MHIKWWWPTPVARDADEGGYTLALTVAPSSAAVVAPTTAASSVVTTSVPELPIGITPSTTSASTPPIIVDKWGWLFDQTAHILEECDLESVEPIHIDSCLTSTDPDVPGGFCLSSLVLVVLERPIPLTNRD